MCISTINVCVCKYYKCVCAERLCVISKVECEDSDITKEEADTFMTGELKEEATPQKEEETADDLLADL